MKAICRWRWQLVRIESASYGFIAASITYTADDRETHHVGLSSTLTRRLAIAQPAGASCRTRRRVFVSWLSPGQQTAKVRTGCSKEAAHHGRQKKFTTGKCWTNKSRKTMNPVKSRRVSIVLLVLHRRQANAETHVYRSITNHQPLKQ